MESNSENNGILYFDGVCILCNRFVNFLISRDKNNRLKFAPLQGQTAKDNINASELKKLESVFLQQGEHIYTESEASIRAIASLGGGWKAIRLLRVFPKFLRDKVYRIISANRYQWFGKNDYCRVPTPEERNKFLA